MGRNDKTENRLRSLAIQYSDLADRLDELELETEHEEIRDAIEDLAERMQEAQEAIDNSVEQSDDDEE